MAVIERIKDCFSEDVWNYISENTDAIREIRLRSGRPVQVITHEDKLLGEPISAEIVQKLLLKLTDFSLYSKEHEISEGYFTLKDGSRVGVCGKSILTDGRVRQMTHIGSVSIRIAHVCEGCSDTLMPLIISDGKLNSTLIFSSPGFGKTTLLRDIARNLSERGVCVAIADERHEIAACIQGVPSVNVGPRTDVMDGCPKGIAVYQLIRAMSPRVLITDEIGDENDAKALEDAARSGVSIMASAHAGGFEDLLLRGTMSDIMRSGIFRIAVQLGKSPGRIMGVWRYIAEMDGGGCGWVRV